MSYDRRDQGQWVRPFVYDDEGERRYLPTRKAVCPACDGTGSYVNPNIDRQGISSDEMMADPDFANAYMNGVYDVTCETCEGRNVVDELDRDAAHEDDVTDWDRWCDQERAYLAERAAEMAAGC